MNFITLIAAVVGLLTAGVHIFVGGKDTAIPLLNTDLEDQAKYTFYSCWHFISAFLGISSLVLLFSAFNLIQMSNDLTIFISVLWLAAGLAFLIVSLLKYGLAQVLRLPQWILLLPVGILILFTLN